MDIQKEEEMVYDTMAMCGESLIHLHLHDFVERDHYPPFDGAIEWREIFQALRDIEYPGEFMFEAGVRRPFIQTLEKTVAFPGEFSRRYAKIDAA